MNCLVVRFVIGWTDNPGCDLLNFNSPCFSAHMFVYHFSGVFLTFLLIRFNVSNRYCKLSAKLSSVSFCCLCLFIELFEAIQVLCIQSSFGKVFSTYRQRGNFVSDIFHHHTVNILELLIGLFNSFFDFPRPERKMK